MLCAFGGEGIGSIELLYELAKRNINCQAVVIGGTSESTDRAFEKFAKIYPDTCEPSHKKLVPDGMDGVKPLKVKKQDMKYPGTPVDKPTVYIPVFPGTNCDYDTAKAFRKASLEAAKLKKQ